MDLTGETVFGTDIGSLNIQSPTQTNTAPVSSYVVPQITASPAQPAGSSSVSSSGAYPTTFSLPPAPLQKIQSFVMGHKIEVGIATVLILFILIK